MIPVEQCTGHDYIYIKQETVIMPEPYIKLIPKTIYACTHCGVALEVYELDRKIDVNRNE